LRRTEFRHVESLLRLPAKKDRAQNAIDVTPRLRHRSPRHGDRAGLDPVEYVFLERWGKSAALAGLLEQLRMHAAAMKFEGLALSPQKQVVRACFQDFGGMPIKPWSPNCWIPTYPFRGSLGAELRGYDQSSDYLARVRDLWVLGDLNGLLKKLATGDG
jgi:hypothetical protein